MPYKLDAQRRLFHAKLARHEISAKTVNEFDQASKGKKLPEYVKKSLGGLIENDMKMKMHDGKAGLRGMNFGRSMAGPQHRVFPPAGVKFEHGGEVYSSKYKPYDLTEEGEENFNGPIGDSFEEDNSGLAEKYSGKDIFAEGGMVSCPECGHQFEHSEPDGDEYDHSKPEPTGPNYARGGEMGEGDYEMGESESNMGEPMQNPDFKKKMHFAKALRMHKRG